MNQFVVTSSLFALLLLAIPFPAHASKASLMCAPLDNIDPNNRFQFRVRNPGKGAIPAGAAISVRATMTVQTKFDRPYVDFNFTLSEALNPAVATTFEGTANAKSCTASAKW
jgi:hypothetical protein